MISIRFRGDDAIIIGDISGTEIVIEPADIANLHHHLGAVLADRAARLKAIAEAV